GGHSNTVVVEDGERELGLDTGFVVYNEAAYPGFSRLLAELRVATRPSDMSFGVSCAACGVEFSSRGPRGMIADAAALLKPRRWSLAWDIMRFYREGPRAATSTKPLESTLAEFLDSGHYSGEFRRHF